MKLPTYRDNVERMLEAETVFSLSDLLTYHQKKHSLLGNSLYVVCLFEGVAKATKMPPVVSNTSRQSTNVFFYSSMSC